MAHFRSTTRNVDGTWPYCLASRIAQFTEAFPDAGVPYDTFVYRRHVILQCFENKHCVCKRKSTERPTVLTEEVVRDIKHRIEISPPKSVAKLSIQTGLFVGSCHKALRTSFNEAYNSKS